MAARTRGSRREGLRAGWVGIGIPVWLLEIDTRRSGGGPSGSGNGSGAYVHYHRDHAIADRLHICYDKKSK